MLKYIGLLLIYCLLLANSDAIAQESNGSENDTAAAVPETPDATDSPTVGDEEGAKPVKAPPQTTPAGKVTSEQPLFPFDAKLFVSLLVPIIGGAVAMFTVYMSIGFRRQRMKTDLQILELAKKAGAQFCPAERNINERLYDLYESSKPRKRAFVPGMMTLGLLAAFLIGMPIVAWTSEAPDQPSLWVSVPTGAISIFFGLVAFGGIMEWLEANQKEIEQHTRQIEQDSETQRAADQKRLAAYLEQKQTEHENDA